MKRVRALQIALSVLSLLIVSLHGCASTGTAVISNNGSLGNNADVPTDGGAAAVGDRLAESDAPVSLMEAIEKSAEKIASELPKDSRVAIISFESEHINLSEFVMEELAGALFDRKIEVADRQNVELVSKELNFQMSGAVDDDAVKAAGKFLAADMVITGQLIGLGDSYRYRTNAVHVEQATRASVTRFDVRGGDEMKNMIATLAAQATEVKTARFGVSEDNTPQTAGSFIDRGILFANRGDYEMAIEDFTGALKLDSTIARAYALRGRALVAGSSDVAEKSADFSEILVWIRQSTPEQEQILDLAIADFTQAIRLDPQNAVYYRERGRAHFLKKDDDKAIADFDRAVQINLSYAPAYISRAVVYSNRGDHDKASEDYGYAIQADPNNAAAYRSRGNIYRRKGDLDSAIADFDRAIQIDPNDAYAYDARGTTYQDKGDLELAIADYTKAIEINPNDAEAYANRAAARFAKNDIANAIDDYEAALRIDPNNNNVKRSLEEVRKAVGR